MSLTPRKAHHECGADPRESVCPRRALQSRLSRSRDGGASTLACIKRSSNTARRPTARPTAELEGTMWSGLKRTSLRTMAALGCAAALSSTASAAYISADLVRAGAHTWDVNFTVSADPGQVVEAFTVYFDWMQVSNLQVWGTPLDWDSLVIQADSALMADGFFDTLALANGIVDPKALGGFIARFDWADDSGPTGFRYTVNDPVTFDTIERGSINVGSGGGGTTVPEPATWALLVVGTAAAASRSRRASSRL